MSKKRRQYNAKYKFQVALEAAKGQKTVSQFTAHAFTSCLEDAGIRISMDGRGRALDNVFIERLWRSVKYEHIYINEYSTVPQLHDGLAAYFWFYNEDRLHQSLGYRPPVELHFPGRRG